jgi:acetylornithine deacetylase/succinyl-diaminopimelate desuccinylase-like protein
MESMTDWENYLVTHKDRFLEELVEFLRIPSISALPAHRADVERAAMWLEGKMISAGLESVRILPTGGHPVVYGEWLHAPGRATLLIYGHFDVQPVDPLDGWRQPPFEPLIVDGRIYARGASDDKGNLFLPLVVAEAMLKTEGSLPVNLKFLFEGQEEIGSPQLADFVSRHRDLLACDMVISADGGQWDEDHPAVVLGTRGLTSVFLDVQGPDHDLHSGTYGGTIQNPIHGLVKILSALHDAQGRVAVPGFYDRVRPLSAEEKAQIARVPFSEEEFLKKTGASALFGEMGFSTYERAWIRPTLEVNGIYGGFQGEGLKTVLPSSAHAKISCRLVADQDPGEIADRVVRHIHEIAPPGVKVRTARAEKGAFPYRIPPDHRGLQIAASVLQELYGKEPYRVWMGGTIPANALFLEALRAYTVIFAFGLRDERQHSPNEFFRLSSWERGQRAYGRLWKRMREANP